MGCHTWVFANGIEIPNDVLNKVPKRLKRNETICLMFIELIEKFKENFDEIYKEISLLLGAGDEFYNINDFVTDKLHEAKISDIQSFDFIVNFHNYLVNSIDFYKKSLKQEKLTKKIISNLNKELEELRENVVHELLEEYCYAHKISTLFVIKDNKYYSQTNIHDPFRVYDYAKEFHSKDELLKYLLGENTEKIDASMWVYSMDKQEDVIKTKNYDDFKKQIILTVDHIYSTYPDAIIQLD